MVAVEVPIAWQEIQDIDHPGSTAAAIGTTLGSIGLLLPLIGLAIDPDILKGGGGGPMYIATMAVPGVIFAISGIPVAIWGWCTWADSRSAAGPFSTPKVSPVALTDGERMYYGLGLSWRW
jgi:hypothetical protein